VSWLSLPICHRHPAKGCNVLPRATGSLKSGSTLQATTGKAYSRCATRATGATDISEHVKSSAFLPVFVAWEPADLAFSFLVLSIKRPTPGPNLSHWVILGLPK
jgi:hypothetical protein